MTMNDNEQAGLPPVPANNDEQQQRRRRRPVVLLILGILLLAALGAFVYYTVTGQSPTTLPVVKAVTRGLPPHFLFNIFDISRPVGVAISPDGQRLYVTETMGDRLVKVFNRAGQMIGSFSGASTSTAQRMPVYVAVGPDGMVYMVDQMVNEVIVLTADGQYVRGVKPPDAPWVPLGIATDAVGNIYVTDGRPAGTRVNIFDRQLNFVSAIPIPELAPSYSAGPTGIAVDNKGRLFVSLTLGNRVDAYQKNAAKLGTMLKAGSASLGLPKGVAVDDQDRMYAVDSLNGIVAVYDTSAPDFKYMFSFSAFGDGDGQLRYPSGIAADRTGRVYVADTNHDLVQVWSY